MITRDELKRIFKLFRKHEDLLVNAALDSSGEVNESTNDTADIDLLIDARLLWRPASTEPVRLTRELASLFERVLRDPRRLTLDADIGGFIVNIEDGVNRYKEAVRVNSKDDISHYLGQIERLVDDLRCSLLDSSGQLWQKIASDFGYVSSLELKIKENESVLSQAKRLNDSMAMIKVSELGEIAGQDPRLKKYLLKWLLDSLEECRKETADAIHKLNDLLFEFKKQQTLGRMIDSFYRKYQNSPGYEPLDYCASGKIPEIFNQATSMRLDGHADLDDPTHEVTLIEIAKGLRKEIPQLETTEIVEAIQVVAEQEPVEPTLNPLAKAVEAFYTEIQFTDDPQSALDYMPSEEVEGSPELWLYAVISRYNSMSSVDRSIYSLSFDETRDHVFDGNRLVHDVNVTFLRDMV